MPVSDDDFRRSLSEMCSSARQQLEAAEASGKRDHIESWQAIVAQCEDVIAQFGGRTDA